MPQPTPSSMQTPLLLSNFLRVRLQFSPSPAPCLASLAFCCSAVFRRHVALLLTQNFHVACNKATVAKRKSVFSPCCLSPLPPCSPLPVTLALAPRKQLNAFSTFNMQATRSCRYLKLNPSCVPLATPHLPLFIPCSLLCALPLPLLLH